MISLKIPAKKNPALNLLFFLLALFIIHYSLFIPSAFAQDCPDNNNQIDYHSLRPNPADPCNKKAEDLSYICGNTMVVKDKIQVLPGNAISCRNDFSSKTKICDFSLNRNLTISVDTTDSDLPIAGNTELVPSSQRPDSELTEADRVNEYLSWYLNGVINRAEEVPLDAATKESLNLIVNYSGPIKKLLPQAIQQANQIEAIASAEKTNHNQIVVCAQEGFLGILGKTKPHKCYSGNGSPAKSDVYKLENWNGDLSWFNGLANRFGADVWNKRIPPLPWDEKYKDNPTLYLKHYNEWRGKSCLILPVINKLVCADNPLIRNKWADLFPYVPLSSTEDRKGSLTVSTPQKDSSSEVEIKNIVFSGQNSTTLYFAHMEEGSQLADTLQTTYLPKDVGNSSSGDVQPPEYGPGCKILEVRSNPGDKLYGGKTNGILDYTAEFSCSFPLVATPSACIKTAALSSKINVAVPLADDIWTKLVAGEASAFRRIFPKLGEGGLGSLIDIPAVTTAKYSADPANIEVSPQTADIYIPHLGGVYEYFLKGIQTILRPKGYGEQIITGLSEGGKCDESVPDTEVPAFYRSIKNSFVDKANRWATGQNKAKECYNTVVKNSIEAGINPLFSLIIWLHESGASNYDYGGSTTQDFGVYDSSIYMNFEKQLEVFLALPTTYKSKYSQCFNNGHPDMQNFAQIYHFGLPAGSCVPSQQALAYLDNTDPQNLGLIQIWGWFTNCSFPKYPTDTGCPK